MRFWCVSPNANANASDLPKWNEVIQQTGHVFLGRSSDRGNGVTFKNKVQIGDLILVAQGSNANKEVLIAGIVDSEATVVNFQGAPDVAQARRLKWIIDKSELKALPLIFDSTCAFGDSNQPHAIFELKLSNSGDKRNIEILLKAIEQKRKSMEIQNSIDLLKSIKPQIILQGPPGTGKTRLAQEIAYQLITGQILPLDEADRRKDLLDLESNPQYKFVQFHPAYSYEDFVRGISVKLTNDQPEYKAVDKTLAEFAKCAQVNLEASKRSGLVEDIPMEEHFQNFVDAIQDELENVESIPLNDAVGITGIKNEAFLYSGKAWKYKDFRMNFSDVLEIYQTGRSSRADVKQLDKVSGLAKQHANYFILMADRFRKFMASQTLTRNAVPVERKDFVLIIDEINRANLPSVLGELIYALEYRGRKVESIYGESKGKEIVIPENLYIIGTMNTADRSVGHIDYAIRRRFAFVHVGPDLEVLSNQPGKDLFNTVASFFSKEKGLLASDFKAEDVQLGHSYFLGTMEEVELKLEYEIKPILREYVKDGILTEAASVIIENLSLTPNDTQNPPASGAV